MRPIASMILLVLLAVSACGQLSIAIVSGDGQATPVSQLFADPVVVQVTDATTNAPAPNEPVTFTSFGNAILAGGNPVLTDSGGFAAMPIAAGSAIGIFNVAAQAPGTNLAVFSLQATPIYDMVLVSGDGQFGLIGADLPRPVEVELRDVFSGMPVPNREVIAASLSPQGEPAVGVMTDTMGIATFSLGVGTATGPIQFRIDSLGADTAFLSAFARGLEVIHAAQAGLLVVNLVYGEFGIPVLAAVDTPMSGFVTTPFGDLHTSLLSPSPSFFAFDGVGALGPPHAGAVTNPNYFRIFGINQAAIAGLSFVFQVHAYDHSKPYPENGFISNPVFLNF